MRLTVETGPLAGTVVTLDRDHPATLGSGADCELRIQEAGVQAQHAVVKALKGEGFGIKALHKGLRVNGAEVEASPLQDGDVIELGTTRVAFGQTQQHGLPTIAGYRILDVLGKGGMGIVYRAEQVSLHRQVALKVLNKDRTRDPGFVAKFVAEARAAAKLQHPNVVSVFDVEHDGDTYYYAMELMHDGSCETWLKQNGAMPVDRALQVVADAAAGLAYAESLGIVHRDIKPDNLMLDQHGQIKIADLGLASQAEAADERAVGTPHFMAPEQVLNRDVDHRTDLYALGCTFYRLVTGKTPFRGQTVKDILRAQVKDQPEPASKANPDVPAEVDAIIQRLMAKEPGDRFQTANELLEAVETLLQPQQKRGLWIALAAAAVLVAGGAIYYAVTKPKEKEIVEKIYDDPEKQQFADRIKVLEREAKRKDAAIALLEARVSGLADEALAAAFDRVATQHEGTPAGTEAVERAAAVRRDLVERERRLVEHRQRIADHLAGLRRAFLTQLDAHDFAGALQRLEQPAPADLAGDADLTAGVARLRDEILTAGKGHVATLTGPLQAARTSGDEAGLTAAIDALERGLEPATRWPAALAGEVAAAKAMVGDARAALVELKEQRVANVWQSYEELLHKEGGLAQRLGALDFAGAAERASSFAGTADAKIVAERAAGLAAALQHANLFGEALRRTMADGKVLLSIGDTAMQVTGWDAAQQQLTMVDTERRGSKAETYATSKLMLDQWIELADQVPAAPPGSRECFLGLLALGEHARAAAVFLLRIDAANDDSGTGEDAYPFGADVFDRLLGDLPNEQDAPWSAVVRDELQAGLHLAAGLRALSERRNLAAAGHLDKLLTAHPHSLVVAALP